MKINNTLHLEDREWHNEFKKLGESSGVYPPVTCEAEIGRS
jgi:hypothetical protein